jgi:hypothetical protein
LGRQTPQIQCTHRGPALPSGKFGLRACVYRLNSTCLVA